MAKKKAEIPNYGTVLRSGTEYYRTRIMDENGKPVVLYAKTREDLFQKETELRKKWEDERFKRENPTVAEYCEKWLMIRSATVAKTTIKGYESCIQNHIIKPLGDMYLADVTADDIRVALIPFSRKSAAMYDTVNMILKSVFYSAERAGLITENPAALIPSKGGIPRKEKEALTDKQVETLLDAIKGLRPYVFIMLGLYAGLRTEEILALQWDSVFLDDEIPYIYVQRAWHTENNRPVISSVLKTPAARRNIPIPKCLSDCLREAKEESISEYVISGSDGQPLAYSQFQRLWKYVKVRTNEDRNYYKYVNGQSIKYTVNPSLGGHQKNNGNIVYSIDFKVTPHILRHTYITNLIYAGVDPKTVQYLAGHENSKTTMDIYAKVKYNKPEELLGVVNAAFRQ